MKKFNREKALKKLEFQRKWRRYSRYVYIAMPCVLCGILGLYLAYSKFFVTQEQEVVRATAAPFIRGDVVINNYVNGQLVDDAPARGTGYKVDKIVRDNGAVGEWSGKDWGPIISNVTRRSKCNIYFVDAEKVNIGNVAVPLDGYGLCPTVKDDGTVTVTEAESQYGYLCKAKDAYGDSYYYRGNVTNNYVKFADKYWRIVRINGDGTVKIVLNDNIDKTSIYDDKTTDKLSSLSKKSNNKLYNLLDQWYQNNLKDYDDLISISKYCVDLTKEKENLANYNRINISNNPTFNCLGNTYSSKIGTLSIDEVIYAGACLNELNTYYYLYNPSITESWWTQSAFKDSVEGLYFYEISANGEILLNSTGESTKSVKPVINLNKDVEATGDGTQQNPYKIK